MAERLVLPCLMAQHKVHLTFYVFISKTNRSESLMRSIYTRAGIDPKDTGYVEAHGTGTKVGDPIEATALHKIFGEGRTARNPLFIGSVKSNIGHVEAASGKIVIIGFQKIR
jgi:acyl transferase domain-containing protein